MTYIIDDTHDPARTSWVQSANGHGDFPIQNLPLGIFSPPEGEPRAGAAIGDMILDLRAAAAAGLLPESCSIALSGSTLNALFALACGERLALRRCLSELLSNAAHRAAIEPMLHAASECVLHLPAAIGDYTDFYVGIHHATNIGKLFRPDNPLLPNYKYVPIGYHGRASSVRPSGEPLVRPLGQRKAPDSDTPLFGPSVRLDLELELGIWIGRGNALGEPLKINEAPDHVAGFCLLNDWSARDLQTWEYQPLGPFLAKNFHSTISPWVITAEALAPFRVAQPPRPDGDPQPLPYLWNAQDQEKGALGIMLETYTTTARMRGAGMTPHHLGSGAATNMYWTVAQIITHHTSGGCNLRPGDLIGTGTISTPDEQGYGSLVEMSRNGTRPVELPSGETRTFLEDGDEIIITARAEAKGFIGFGFGECRAVVLPAP